MALPQTYSRRQRLAKKTEDVFQYDGMSKKLGNQVIHILNDVAELYNKKTRNDQSEVYDTLVNFFRKELGVTELTKTNVFDAKSEFEFWFRDTPETDYVLDAVEMIGNVIAHAIRIDASDPFEEIAYNNRLRAQLTEINERMLENGFGYQLEGDQIIRVDSKFAHKEIVVPALAILSQSKYEAANQEFRDAHQLYRAKEFRKSIHQCGCAFESVLKVISAEKGWELDPNKATASKYLNKVFEEELIPKYIQGELTGLASILKDGVATVRNKAGGHGEGSSKKPIPAHIAAFQLHQTAAAILLLAEANDF